MELLGAPVAPRLKLLYHGADGKAMGCDSCHCAAICCSPPSICSPSSHSQSRVAGRWGTDAAVATVHFTGWMWT